MKTPKTTSQLISLHKKSINREYITYGEFLRFEESIMKATRKKTLDDVRKIIDKMESNRFGDYISRDDLLEALKILEDKDGK